MPIEISEIQRLLRRTEGPKLDFKRDFYAISSPAKEMHWNELIKDILSLANGNIGYTGQPGHLIIGADDKLNSDGTRRLYSCEQVNIDQRSVLERVNNSCHPPIAELYFERVLVLNAGLYIFIVPPTFYLHETIKDLTTTKTTYHKGTVFIRQGESIRNATQAERDAIRNEKQRFSEAIRVTGGLERRIKAVERFIEERKADLAEQRSLSSSERQFNLEHLRDEIDFEIHLLDYLKTRLHFEQSMAPLYSDKAQSGKKYFDYARKLLNEKLPKILNGLNENLPYSNFENARSLLDEIRDDAKNALESAIRHGNSQPRIYLLLMQLCDAKQEILGSYDWGCEALSSAHEFEFAELHQFHLKVCHFVMDLYEDYREDAAMYIEQNKDRLCRILKVEAVDEWGQPV